MKLKETNMIKKFIQDVLEEKNYFNFDQPHRLGEKSLSVFVPIIRKYNKKRSYLTFVEAEKIKVEDTGQIDYLYVENHEDLPVYISKGEIFKGKTQERAAIHGYIIEKNSSARIPVRCIHKTKGIVSGTEMEHGGIIPYSIDVSSQNSTWDSVNCFSSAMSEGTYTLSSNSIGTLTTSFPSAQFNEINDWPNRQTTGDFFN